MVLVARSLKSQMSRSCKLKETRIWTLNRLGSDASSGSFTTESLEFLNGVLFGNLTGAIGLYQCVAGVAVLPYFLYQRL